MTEFKPIPLTETQMAELFRLRQRVAELEKERDKAAQYWQIAEGRCDAMIKQRDDLVESLQDMVQMMDSGDEHGAGSPWHTKARAAIASVKEK